MRTAIIYLFALAAALAGAAFLYVGFFAERVDGDETRSAGKAPPVVVAKVGRQPFVDSLSALGTVHANESVTITANRADHVAALHFEDGQKVEKGALLAEMNVREETAELAEATAVRDDLQLDQERLKNLYDSQLTSQREFEAGRAKLAASEARVRSLQAAIADRRIVAPFTGYLGLRKVSVGAYIQPATVITTLDDLAIVKLDFTIPERWLSTVRVGMTISAASEVWPNDVFEGKVATIATRLDPRTRSATVRARIPNPELKLRPGMLLKVTIMRGEKPVMQVPEEALIPIGNDNYVLRVNDESIAERVTVEVGRRRVGAVEILKGLVPGDRVVTEGIVRVRPGQPVQVVKTVGTDS